MQFQSIDIRIIVDEMNKYIEILKKNTNKIL